MLRLTGVWSYHLFTTQRRKTCDTEINIWKTLPSCFCVVLRHLHKFSKHPHPQRVPEPVLWLNRWFIMWFHDSLGFGRPSTYLLSWDLTSSLTSPSLNKQDKFYYLNVQFQRMFEMPLNNSGIKHKVLHCSRWIAVGEAGQIPLKRFHRKFKVPVNCNCSFLTSGPSPRWYQPVRDGPSEESTRDQSNESKLQCTRVSWQRPSCT